MTNKLFCGHNLDVLREHIASESVDLVYLGPLFNSNANYNILFKSKTTAALPTRPMEAEAAAVGRFESEATGRTYPRIQTITLAELFQGKKPDVPYVDQGSVKRVKREEMGRQDRLI